MTLRASARVAGFAFLAYIALGIAAMIVMGRVGGGPEVAGRLAAYARHAPEVRLAAVLELFCSFCALILAASLYAITRAQDPDLAMTALVFRVAEGVIGGISVAGPLSLLWLATASGSHAPDPAGTRALGAYLLWGQGSEASPIFFAVGSLLFAWLLLRGRMIPTALAWIGVIASLLWVVGFPLQLAGLFPASLTLVLYLPMAGFEIPLALWFIFKGVATPARTAAA